MRIVIDMQGVQSESRYRGIGRYSLGFAQGVVKNRGDHEVILLLNGLFAETISPIMSYFAEILPAKNILIWNAPGPVSAMHEENKQRRKVAERIRTAFIEGLQPDVVHVISLFEGYVDDAVTSIEASPNIQVTTILYDLIPLQNPDQYLNSNPKYAKFYYEKINHLKNATSSFSISEFTRNEGLEYLKLPENRVVNVSTAIDEKFYKKKIPKKLEISLRDHFSISEGFVLYTGGSDERKNLSRLVAAYSKLPNLLRNKLQLVFAGRMPDADVEKLKSIAKKAGLSSDELVFTGYVSDEELINLYNLCELYIFPSWHEGFGLPAVEAMACGAPVIASNTASLPEIINFEAALFDPYDVQSITQKLEQGLTNLEFRNKLRTHGLKQAKIFSWDITAQRAIKHWEEIYGNHQICKKQDWTSQQITIDEIKTKLLKWIAKIFVGKDDCKDVDLVNIANCVQKNEHSIKDFFRNENLPKKIKWRIEGPFDSSYSLALLNREIARAMASLGHEVILHSTEGPGDFTPSKQFLEVNSDVKAMYDKSLNSQLGSCDVVSRNLYPPRVDDMNARFNFLHSYAWEESGFPGDWVANFNDYLQGMTLLSNHVHKIMIDAGVKVPMSVSGCGVDHWLRIDSEKHYKLNAKKFRFLHVSSCFPRKGATLLLEAFGQAFNQSDDVTLIIKTFANPHNNIRQELSDLRKRIDDYPDVQIVEADLSDEQLKALYEQCDVLVAPSYAEGFGLPMAEAMLSGLGVITTNWGGQLDFCNTDNAWLVDYDFQRVESHFELFNSVWAVPNTKDLTDTMIKAFQTPAKLIKQLAENGRKLLLQNFTWKNVAEKMVFAAQNCANYQQNVTAKIGWVTSWGTPCGIATYSEHLVENMEDSELVILAAHTNAETNVDDSKRVVRCWDLGDEDSLTNLSEAIVMNKLNTLVIQFNYGFFNLESFNEFLIEQNCRGLNIIMMMHSTNDPAHVPHKKLSVLSSGLSKCARILVHSVNDLNRLKRLGLIDNVTLFPHGILDYVQKNQPDAYDSSIFTVASYGFFLPNKGLIELINAFAVLKKNNINVRLNMVNAEYPIPESATLIQTAKALIKDKHLEDSVNLSTVYLSDTECLARLSRSDLIVFPYQKTGESASGAVRYGLATGKAVAVTPCDIFDDVSPAVHFLKGIGAEDIADGIAEMMNDINNNSSNYITIQNKAKRWVDEHRYSKVALRLNNLINSINLTKKKA